MSAPRAFVKAPTSRISRLHTVSEQSAATETPSTPSTRMSWATSIVKRITFIHHFRMVDGVSCASNDPEGYRCATICYIQISWFSLTLAHPYLILQENVNLGKARSCCFST